LAGEPFSTVGGNDFYPRFGSFLTVLCLFHDRTPVHESLPDILLSRLSCVLVLLLA
jgi:hypothetical protein